MTVENSSFEKFKDYSKILFESHNNLVWSIQEQEKKEKFGKRHKKKWGRKRPIFFLEKFLHLTFLLVKNFFPFVLQKIIYLFSFKIFKLLLLYYFFLKKIESKSKLNNSSQVVHFYIVPHFRLMLSLRIKCMFNVFYTPNYLYVVHPNQVMRGLRNMLLTFSLVQKKDKTKDIWVHHMITLC